MSQSQRKKVDLQFFLPKKGSSTVSLPKKGPFKTTETKTIDLHIEDFLERLNDPFIESPSVLIGEQRVFVYFWFDEDNIRVDVTVDKSGGVCCDVRSILVIGHVGNLTFEKRADENKCERLIVELGSVEKVKEAMTNSGNHSMDLQLTLTAVTWEVADEWIIPK